MGTLIENKTRSAEEIKRRISEEEEILKKLDSEIKRELALPFFDRNRGRVEFIYFETSVHKARLAELKWMLYA
jgi:hypothetical protein